MYKETTQLAMRINNIQDLNSVYYVLAYTQLKRQMFINYTQEAVLLTMEVMKIANLALYGSKQQIGLVSNVHYMMKILITKHVKIFFAHVCEYCMNTYCCLLLTLLNVILFNSNITFNQEVPDNILKLSYVFFQTSTFLMIFRGTRIL